MSVGTIISRTGGGDKHTIVGVIDDFVYNSMYAPAAPLILYADTSNVNVLTIHLKAGSNLKASLAKIENVVKADNPGYPVEFNFVDDQLQPAI